MSDPFPSSLIDQVDELLTDTKHPLDEKQARRMSLMLLREIFNDQLEIKRNLDKVKFDIDERRARLDETIKKVQTDIDELWRYVREYPSLTWLLRFKFKPTVTWLVIFVVVVTGLFWAYREWLLAQLGLPPFP